MFVPYKPDLAFDTYRTDDRCVCGCSATNTHRQGIKKGYCENCYQKKKGFIDKITKRIDIEGNNVFTLYIKQLEKIRINICEEIISHRIDEYYGNTNVFERFCEPYDNPTFIFSIYVEKFEITSKFITSIKTSKVNKIAHPFQAKANEYIENYILELEKMVLVDCQERDKTNENMHDYFEKLEIWEKKNKKVHQ